VLGQSEVLGRLAKVSGELEAERARNGGRPRKLSTEAEAARLREEFRNARHEHPDWKPRQVAAHIATALSPDGDLDARTVLARLRELKLVRSPTLHARLVIQPATPLAAWTLGGR
jgi:hypothetical protein